MGMLYIHYHHHQFFGTRVPMTSPLPGGYPPREDPQFRFDATPSLAPSERSDPMKHKKKIPPRELPQGK
eukprot:8745475-Prorocentrum_lima.AAC.1